MSETRERPLSRGEVPYDEDAEIASLGSILIDDDALLEMTSLEASDFFLEEHQHIFSAILKISRRGESINQITLAQELIGAKKLNDIGGTAYLSQLVSMVPTSIHAKHYAQIVKNTSIRRRLISATDQIASACYNENDPVKIISDADRLLLGIQSSLSVPHLITPGKLAELGIDYYGKLRDPANRVAVSTGFEQLDLCTGGLFPGEYWIIAARAGLGKSQVALQIAQNVGKNGPVLIFSLEMHWRQILDRLTAQQVGVPVRKIRSGGYDDDLMSRIYNIALPSVSESNLFLFELGNNAVEMPLVTIPMITSMTRHMKMAYGLSLVIIDYIGLVDAPREDMRSSRAEQVSHISRGIKGLTTSLEVPVIAVAQINREPERRANRRPELSDLRDCITGDTLVLTSHGTLQRIDTLVNKKHNIVSININGTCENDVGTVYEAGIKPVYELTTLMGYNIKSTGEHLFFTPSGFSRLDELHVGDVVGLVNKVPLTVWRDIDNDLCRFLGYMMGDGCMAPLNSPGWTESDEIVIDDFTGIVSKHFPAIGMRRQWRKGAYNITLTQSKFGINHNPIINWLRDLGVWGQYSHQRCLPISFILANEEQIANLLRGLFTADGTIKLSKNGTNVISYDTNSKALYEQVRFLLFKLGLPSSTSICTADAHNATTKWAIQRHDAYRISLHGKETIDKFINKVGFVGKKNLRCATRMIRHPRDIVNRLPYEAVAHAREIAKSRGLSHSDLGYRSLAGKGIERQRLIEINKVLNDDYLNQLLKMDIMWLPIKSINFIGNEMTYDMTVEKNHNFIANYFVVHNSGSLEQDADVVSFIYRDDYYDSEAENKGEAEYWIAKQRQGESGIKLMMHWDKDYGRYKEFMY